LGEDFADGEGAIHPAATSTGAIDAMRRERAEEIIGLWQKAEVEKARIREVEEERGEVLRTIERAIRSYRGVL
jgi:hypothetical protein